MITNQLLYQLSYTGFLEMAPCGEAKGGAADKNSKRRY
jgi:hypothetical protein